MGAPGSNKGVTAGQCSCSDAYDWLDPLQDFTPAGPNTVQEVPAKEVCEEDPVQELSRLVAPTSEPAVAGIWQEKRFELDPRDERNLKMAEGLLEDDLAYIKYEGTPSESAEPVEERLIELETLVFQARHGAPLDTGALFERARRLHEGIGELKELDSLSFVDPSRLHAGDLPPVKDGRLIEQLRTDIAAAIATEDDAGLEEARGHLATLKKFAEHTQMRRALAQVVRDHAPLAVKAGEVGLSLSLDECDAQTNPLYNTSELPCGHLEESAFYKALAEMRAGNGFTNLEKGFNAVFSQNSEELLAGTGADPYGRIEQIMEDETAAIEGAGLGEFFEKVASIQYAASGAGAMADNKARARQGSALIEAYDNTIGMIDLALGDNTQGIDRAGFAETLLDGLKKEAADIQRESSELAPLLEDEDVKAGYAVLSGSDTPTPAQDTPETSIERYNAEDFAGSYEEDGAPRPPGGYVIDGVDGNAQKVIAELDELKYSDLTPEQKLERMKEIISELKAQRAALLRMRLAKEMSGLPDFRGNAEYFAGLDGNSNGAEAKKETDKFLASVEQEAFKSVLDSSLAGLEEAKRDVGNGIYGVIDDHMSTAGYDDLIERLGRARRLFNEGKREEAMAVYLTVHGSPKYTALMLRMAEQNGVEAMAKELAVNVAIVVASAGVAAVVTAPFRAYAAARGMGQAATFVIGTSIEGAAFYAGSETLQSAFTRNGGWGSKDAGEHLFEGSMTVLMFGFINGAMGLVKGLAKARVAAAIEARTGMKLTEAEAETAFNAWLKQASVLKRASYHTGAFTAENLAFLAWENIKETARQGLWDGTADMAEIAGKNLSGEAVYNQILFLCLLKLGNFAAQPLIKPVVGIAQDAALGEKAAEFKALQAEGGAITRDMETYFARTLARPETADRAEADALIARYMAFTQKRLAFIRGLPKEAVSGAAAKSAEADAGIAAEIGNVISARPETERSKAQDEPAAAGWMRSAARYLKWAVTLPAFMVVGAGGLGAPPPPPTRVPRTGTKMPDYKEVFRINRDADLPKVLRKIKEASHNGGAGHRMRIVIQGENGTPADPILARTLIRDLPSQNGTRPVEYEVALSDGGRYYEYRHNDGKAVEITPDGRQIVLVETVTANDPISDCLSDLMALTDAVSEVRIELGSAFPAWTAIEQIASHSYPKGVVVLDHAGREIYRQERGGGMAASFAANRFEDIDGILAVPVPDNVKKKVVIGADVMRTALRGVGGHGASMGMLLTGEYDVTVEVKSDGGREATAVELLVKYPSLQEVTVKYGNDLKTFTRAGLAAKIAITEARAGAVFLELPPDIRSAMEKAMKEDEWKPGALAGQKDREHDIRLVNMAANPACTSELRRLASRTTPEGEQLRELLEIFADGAAPAPQLAWMWLRALAIKAEDPQTTARFDGVVEKTLALYKMARASGKQLTGAVIETVAASDGGCLEMIGYDRVLKRNEIDIENKLQGSRGEIATLEYLLSRPEVVKIEVISRSGAGSGSVSTPDLKITYKDPASGGDVVELWDIKTSIWTHRPVDEGQFTRSAAAEKAARYRVIMLGGAKDPSAPQVIKADPSKGLKRDILIHHIPQIKPSITDMLSIRMAI